MFYIKKITLKTEDGNSSSVSLTSGLNIICGESNTGKTNVFDCIDYMLGAEKHRFGLELGITEIIMIIDVDGSDLTLRRKIDANEIEVATTIEDIENGTYKLKKSKKNISQLWLKLMGIDEPVKVFMTTGGDTQDLTIRTIYHTFLVDEDDVPRKESILASTKGIVGASVSTPVLSELLYFATGNNYMPDSLKRPKKIREQRKDAVQSFVDRSMKALSEKKVSELPKLPTESPEELQSKIDATIDEIGAAEGALDQASLRRQELTEEIYRIDKLISENRVLQDRNNSLLSQYESDIRRLTFITEGEIVHGKMPTIEVCPFCNGELKKDKAESCIDAAIAEVEKIQKQILDLKSVQTAIEEENKELNSERKAFIEQRSELDVMIRGELRPQLEVLKSHVREYEQSLKQLHTKEWIESFSDVLVEQLMVTEEEESGDGFKFDAKAKFNEVFRNELNSQLKELLKECNYPNFTGAYFDEDEFDIVVNGKTKMSQGQGYRAILNSILIIALHNCLDAFGHYKPGLLVLDSPIQSLYERNSDDPEKLPDTMKAGLFKYLIDHADTRQTIIIENYIPKIEYGDVNMIPFTKDPNNGRYGLIEGYTE